MTPDASRRRLAFAVLCLGTLMIVLDTTIVNVALPSIQGDLGFADASLAWVVNAYMLTFGGFLLLGGRLGDLYGPRRLFLAGLTLFTAASVACGLAPTQATLVVARSVQGLGGAVVSAVSLSLIMNLFREPGERAKAMGVFGFVASGGGAIGGPLGGILTDAFGWQSVFLVNVPIGIALAFAALRYVDRIPGQSGIRLDAWGAVTVTSALVVGVYAVVGGNQHGWSSARTLGLGTLATALLATFLAIEARVREPLMPLALFRSRNLATANVMGVLWSAAMFAWFFLSALYLQGILGFSAMQVGLAFLPANVIMAAFSVGLSARLVQRFGIRPPLVAGLLLATLGLLLFARAPADGSVWLDVLPGMVLLGMGAGMAFNPMLLAAMGDVSPKDAGLASGIVNTSFMMGGALGLAVLASIAAARAGDLASAGLGDAAATNGGFHAAFLVGAGFAALAALLGAVLLRPATPADGPAVAPHAA